jgi:hypothetical protein
MIDLAKHACQPLSGLHVMQVINGSAEKLFWLGRKEEGSSIVQAVYLLLCK